MFVELFVLHSTPENIQVICVRPPSAFCLTSALTINVNARNVRLLVQLRLFHVCEAVDFDCLRVDFERPRKVNLHKTYQTLGIKHSIFKTKLTCQSVLSVYVTFFGSRKKEKRPEGVTAFRTKILFG